MLTRVGVRLCTRISAAWWLSVVTGVAANAAPASASRHVVHPVSSFVARDSSRRAAETMDPPPNVTGPDAPVHVQGRVVKPGAESMIPMSHLMVTLHRVGSDTAGPVDSMRTTADGHYHFDYHRTGASDAVYFTAASYGGVAYFSAPFKSDTPPTTDDAEITVFDTTSKPVPIDVRGRHLVVGALDAQGTRRITEVFELSNDTSVTRVAVGDAPSGASWSVALPSAARQPEVPEGDIPAGAVQFAQGRALVYAPMAPGVKQLVVSYLVPDGAFPLDIALHDSISVFEVLLEEPQATATGVSFRSMGTVSLGGRAFRRFLATNVAANQTVHLDTPSVPRPINPWYMAGLTIVIGGAMVGALAYALKRR